MLDTRIAEAENMLKMLATEQKVTPTLTLSGPLASAGISPLPTPSPNANPNANPNCPISGPNHDPDPNPTRSSSCAGSSRPLTPRAPPTAAGRHSRITSMSACRPKHQSRR